MKGIILVLSFFIGGCCTFRVTNEQCECKEVYKKVAYYLNENVDTTSLDGIRYIKNKEPYKRNEIMDKTSFYFYENRDCWIGKKSN